MLTPEALHAWAATRRIGENRADRVLRAVYQGGLSDFDELRGFRADLRRDMGESFHCDALPTPQVFSAADGARKLLFRLEDGRAIESVILPDERRLTVCVSSQVGCAMACAFCATAKLGLHRSLSAAEIVGQLVAVRRLLGGGRRISNVVFMGMGEPLHNYAEVVAAVRTMRADWGFGLSGRRITVSTVGLLPELQRLVRETDVAIAVSLTATEDALRDRLMPANRRYPLAQLMDCCRSLPIAQRRRITFEYVLLGGVNDGVADARRLQELVRGVRAKVNLIPFNSFPGAPYEPPPAETVQAFRDTLLAAGLSATVRKLRGGDVRAACGQLAAAAVS